MDIVIKKLNKEELFRNYINWNNQINQYFPKYDIRNNDKRHIFFEILHKNEFAGFFDIYNGNRIQKFFIIKKFQSQGIGSVAVKNIIDFFQHNKLKGLNCLVKKTNVAALNFWKKNGFITTKEYGEIIYLSKKID